MNRSFLRFFHETVQSSSSPAVEQLWNLCQTRTQLKMCSSLTLISAAPGTNSPHEGSRWNSLHRQEVASFSTSPKPLLLLLVYVLSF
jgi:hypothetical protein